MTTQVKQTHSAEYLYPGSFYPEETYRSIPEPTLAAALKKAPRERSGYFRKDGWYAVIIRTSTLKRFVAGDGTVEWVRQGQPETVLKVIVGEKVHADSLPDDDAHRILISNIRCNTKSGYGVRTRRGNWQFADDWDQVVAPEQVAS